jgi:glycosyltransferase involved in cell wall biosynthesis
VQACEQDESIHVDGVPVHFVRETTVVDGLSLRLGSKLAAAQGVLSRVAELDPQVVHVNGLGYPLQLLLLRKRLPRAAIVVQDHAAEPASGWRKALHRRGCAAADAVLFTAREQAAPFFENGQFRPDLPVFEVLEDSSFFVAGDQQDARLRSGIHGDPCLLWLGRLDAVKDPLGVLDAVAMASDQLPGIRLWCCYRDAPLEQQVKARIASDPRLRERALLLGPRPHAEIETLCQAADFLIQGSLREGSGYAVVEALACGTTPLVTDIPAFRKITKQGQFGALAAPRDAAGMAQNLIEWAGKDRHRLRQEARRHFEDELSYEAIGRDLRAVYEAVAERR